MEITYFFDGAFFKDNSVVDDNVDGTYIKFSMRTAQEMYIQPILGSNLYKDILAELVTDPTLATKPLYKTLIDDYIQQAMIFLTLAELTVWCTFKFTNKSLMRKTDQNGETIETTDMTYVKELSTQRGQWYLKRLQEYLLEHVNDYPKYLNGEFGIDTIHPESKVYRTGMALGVKRPVVNGIDSYKDPTKPYR
jgi:hypothetical protein